MNYPEDVNLLSEWRKANAESFTKGKPILALCCLFVCLFGCSGTELQPEAAQDRVPIKGGSFIMGTRAADIPALKAQYDVNFPGVFENEVPARRVVLDDFLIDRFEVSNVRYFEFLEDVPAWRKNRVADATHNGDYLSSWVAGRFPDGEAQRPIGYITWSSAMAYCQWRGGRLPTEAEWEYVARSGDEREFIWGAALPDPSMANYSASDIGTTVEVGQYAPNDFGVYDLAGNVWEFLLDEWVSDYTDVETVNPVVGGRDIDLDSISPDSRRAVRGASFGGSVVNLRTRWRDSHVVSNATEFVGFRCAYDLPVDGGNN